MVRVVWNGFPASLIPAARRDPRGVPRRGAVRRGTRRRSHGRGVPSRRRALAASLALLRASITPLATCVNDMSTITGSRSPAGSDRERPSPSSGSSTERRDRGPVCDSTMPIIPASTAMATNCVSSPRRRARPRRRRRIARARSRRHRALHQAGHVRAAAHDPVAHVATMSIDAASRVPRASRMLRRVHDAARVVPRSVWVASRAPSCRCRASRVTTASSAAPRSRQDRSHCCASRPRTANPMSTSTPTTSCPTAGSPGRRPRRC